MHGFLWFLQIALALSFAAVGIVKLTQPNQRLRPSMGWVDDYPAERVKQIGGLEVLAAIGLVLPGWTGIMTWLTPLAATGIVVLMVLAVFTHQRRGEPHMITTTAALGAVAAFVAIFRFGPFSW